MSATNKPALDDLYLEHFGVKGMRWGFRKSKEEGESTVSVTVSNKATTTAAVAAGAAATGFLLYKTGTLGVASSVASEGAKLSAQILASSGRMAFDSIRYVGGAGVSVGAEIGRNVARAAPAVGRFAGEAAGLGAQAVGSVLRGAGRGAWKVASIPVRAIANTGKGSTTPVFQRNGKRPVRAIFNVGAKLRRLRGKG